MNNFNKFQKIHAEKIVNIAKNKINLKIQNKKLAESMEYSLMAGGKRVRPILFLATLATFEKKELEKYYDISASLELIHTYSLIHDDLPEMDNDDLRRGKPTNHKVFGVGQAVLAGDALLTMAFQFVSENLFITDKQKVDLINILSEKAGAQGMVSGQWIDISNENHELTFEDLKQLHSQKTGDLLLASFLMAVKLTNASNDDIQKITNFAKKVGLAFQVKDDILDVTSTTEKLGKQTQKDSNEGKNTFPALLGLEESKGYLKKLCDSAHEDLLQINKDTSLLDDFLKYFELGE
ncbi:polyprenyl synthetase family protein [Companilactobacillus sp. DQM5]|uniref:polyprenyl synthetase family protein n=1 Tax=Companilactobacillus sp. DQM5 TaxID=3463359 RepID=UPI004059B656